MKLGPFNPGDPIPREAAFYSAVGQAAAAHMAKQSRLSGLMSFEGVPLNVLVVKNNTGAALDRGSIVGLGEAVITPTDSEESFRSGPVIYAEEIATPTHFGKWAVLYEPLRADAVGWAVAFGVYAVQVDFTYDDSPYADISDGVTANLVDDEGGVPVLWKESGTGVKWAVVMLGHPTYPTLKCTLDSDVTAAGDTTVSVGSTGRNITANVPVAPGTDKKWASGSVVFCAWDAGVWNVISITVCPVDDT